MSDIRTSFTYDPTRQGYDTNSWRSISGAPAVVGGRLSIDNAVGIAGSAISFVDFVKGDISFDVNVPEAPVEGSTRMFGVASLNTTSYIRFLIGDDLQCQVSDGITTSATVVSWDNAWNGTNTLFRIRWESGSAKFFINGTQVCAISDAANYASSGYSVITVPHGPLSLYLYDGADTAMTIGDITVRGTQSYVLNPKTSDATPVNPTGDLSLSQTVTVTENVTFNVRANKTFTESVTITENVSLKVTAHEDFAETMTITELVTMNIPVITGIIYEGLTVDSVFTGGVVNGP